MAARRSGLGKGLDGLFPSYATQNENPREEEEKTTKTRVSGKKAKNGTDGKSFVEDNTPKNRHKSTKKTDESNESAAASAEDGIQGGVITVRISEVEPNREQPRKQFRDDRLAELADSISKHGIVQPLVVKRRDDYYEIIAGERRWRAAKIAGLKEIPVIVQDYSEQEIVEISLIENIQREDLNPVEEALAYQKLLDEFGLKQEEVAQRVSKSRTAVTNTLRLLRLDERVRQMLMEEKISSGHARALLAEDDPDIQYELAKKTADENLSVRDVEELMRRRHRPPSRKKQPPQDQAVDLVYKEMEDRMKASLGTKVTVKRTDEKKGRIEIEYYSREELERLYDILKNM